MKKFLPLLLLLLAPVWAAPLAEAADVEVALSGGELNTEIRKAIQAKVTSGEVAFDSIKVTLTGSSSITSTIVIPYSGTFASSDSSSHLSHDQQTRGRWRDADVAGGGPTLQNQLERHRDVLQHDPERWNQQRWN